MVGIGAAELFLRSWVPLSSIVDPNSLHPVVWYLDNLESLEEQEQEPAQVSHPLLGWTYAKNLRKGELSTNSAGMRGRREYALQRAPGVRRGMVLGDSFSAGYGVADDQTFAARLENLLPGTEILNLAVPGYGVDQAILRWEVLGRPYEPDFIILGIFMPDFHRNVGEWRFSAPKPRFRVVDGALQLSNTPLPAIEDVSGNEQRIRAKLAPLLNAPRVWVAANYAAQRLAGRMRGWREPDETFDEKSRVLELLIARLAADCRERNIDLLVVTILTDYAAYPDEERILAVIADAAAEASVPVLGLGRDLGAQEGEGEVFDPETQHWSPYGHKLAAAQIAEFLRERRIVEPPVDPGI